MKVLEKEVGEWWETTTAAAHTRLIRAAAAIATPPAAARRPPPPHVEGTGHMKLVGELKPAVKIAANESDIVGMTLQDAMCLVILTGCKDTRLKEKMSELETPAPVARLGLQDVGGFCRFEDYCQGNQASRMVFACLFCAQT